MHEQSQESIEIGFEFFDLLSKLLRARLRHFTVREQSALVDHVGAAVRSKSLSASAHKLKNRNKIAKVCQDRLAHESRFAPLNRVGSTGFEIALKPF